jgi:putative oxidoreductase
VIVTTLVALALPATAATIYVIYRPLWATAGHSAVPVDATYKAIATRSVLFVLALYALVLATIADLSGIRSVAPRAAVVLFGACCIALGDLLPRTRPNLLIGIRTARTLDDRELWLRMHRVSGYVAVLFGVVVMIAGMFLSRSGISDVVGIAMVLSAAALPIAYWIYSTPLHMTDVQRRARRLALAHWLLRVALSLIFIYVGFIKIPGRVHPMWVRVFNEIGFGQWFRFFTAFVEIIGGMLLVVPSATFVAVFLLASAMVGALLVHLFIFGIGFATVIVVLLLGGVLTIGWHEKPRWVEWR